MKIWSSLDHPNVVPLMGHAVTSELGGSQVALISPALDDIVCQWYVQGDAADFLDKNGSSLTLSERIYLWKGVVQGLDYLHNFDPTVVHGDLKPLVDMIGALSREI
ncbi:hypothetical protein FRC17_009596 [Serendipita sp. 399]|nr:hypothetical protein FRC17_009596 [Serendipita sp. 399]